MSFTDTQDKMLGKSVSIEYFIYNLNMTSSRYLDLLPEITRRIISVSDPEKVILFGSYARGESQEESDLDLLIILKKISSTRFEANRIRRALRGLLVPVDLIIATNEQISRYRNTPGLIYQAALTEGNVLYERPA